MAKKQCDWVKPSDDPDEGYDFCWRDRGHEGGHAHGWFWEKEQQVDSEQAKWVKREDEDENYAYRIKIRDKLREALRAPDAGAFFKRIEVIVEELDSE